MSEWQPIEKYDRLKKKPKLAVFFVAADTSSRHSTNHLRACISTSRHFGSRKITHYLVLPHDPIKEGSGDE